MREAREAGEAGGRTGEPRRYPGLAGACAAFLATILFFGSPAECPKAGLTAAVALLMSVLWITEAIPLAATSLLPLVLFPLLGISNGKVVAASYVNSTIFLFLGGFLIAIAMERWHLHKRIAINLILLFGVKPQRIILGFMIAAASLSMWISNTATAVMLLPVGMAILAKTSVGAGRRSDDRFAVALMLGIAYSCSVGGIATPIGTPPNLVFQRVFAISFPGRPEVSFSRWMLYAVPLAGAMLVFIWFLLTRVLFRFRGMSVIDRAAIEAEREGLGRMAAGERSVAVVFALTALLWVFRSEMDLGFLRLPGWSALFARPEWIDDGTVSILMAALLFFLPAPGREEAGVRRAGGLLDAGAFRKVPWEVILLFGGGFALAEGFVSSKLSEWIGARFGALAGTPPLLAMLAVCLTITFLTELTSNTATSQIVLPILASLAVTLEIRPELLMVPATISASMAFMMPVATPPNAIVFGSGRLRIKDMARAGLIINLAGAILIAGYSYWAVGILS